LREKKEQVIHNSNPVFKRKRSYAQSYPHYPHFLDGGQCEKRLWDVL
jgi:hypothetical protein